MADPIRVMTMTEPAPEALSADEMAYHRTVLESLRRAEAARDLWVAHLAQKYGLGPGERILADGALVRGTREDT